MQITDYKVLGSSQIFNKFIQNVTESNKIIKLKIDIKLHPVLKSVIITNRFGRQ